MGLMRFSRLRGALPVSSWMRGGSARIKSIQRGTISIGAGATSNTATITTVDVANTRIKYLGVLAGADATSDPSACRIALTNATTVTASAGATSGGAARVVGYEVIEYYPGAIKSVQRGTIATAGSPSNTATITTVSNAEADFLGFTTTSGQTAPATTWGRIDLTNATTVTFTGLGSVDRTAGYQVIDWF